MTWGPRKYFPEYPSGTGPAGDGVDSEYVQEADHPQEPEQVTLSRDEARAVYWKLGAVPADTRMDSTAFVGTLKAVMAKLERAVGPPSQGEPRA